MGKAKKSAPPKKRLSWPPSKERIIALAVGLCLLLALVVGAVLLRPEDGELTAAQKRMFASARVTDILADDAEPDDWSEGLRLGSQYLELEILSGPYKGAILEAVNYLTAYSNIDCSLGTRVIVRLDVDDNGDRRPRPRGRLTHACCRARFARVR